MRFNSIQILSTFIIIILIGSILGGVSLLYTQDSNNVKKQFLEITVMETASDVRGFQDYDPESNFYPNQTIYVYTEYENITLIDSDKCDLNLEIVVTVDNVVVYYDSELKSEVKNNAHYWYFESNDDWSSGVFLVSITITDNPTSNSISKATTFTFIRL